ncbi:MAG TPA: NAD-binding protein [Candidatus Limnocylindrales bacterium]|nr:NAD-binding protein [Candidatus Limnocylindrales bacterium]
MRPGVKPGASTRAFADVGLPRVLDPPFALPQAARRLDPSLPARPGELVLDCERLQIDSVSFRQFREECRDDVEAIARRILAVVRERGKLENPVTGSGGVLIGRARTASRARGVSRGSRVVSLVSLTLTPLHLERVRRVDLQTHQVHVDGHAILARAFPIAIAPDDLPLGVSLAALDVSSAPAQLARLVRRADRVIVIGAGGASGLLALALARERARDGVVVAVDSNRRFIEDVRASGLADHVVEADATHPVDCARAVARRARFPHADVVVNVVNTPGTEMATVLLCRPRGIVMFFGMATSFSDAALSGDGLGRETRMMVGIGYVEGQAQLALGLLRRHPRLREVFVRRYGHGGEDV